MSNIILKNIFPDNRCYTILGKEFVFRAYEEKEVPETFLDSNGKPRFSGLQLIGFRREDGTVLGYRKPYTMDVEFKKDNHIRVQNQKYVYEFTNLDTNEKHITCRVKEFCEKTMGSDYHCILNYFATGRDKYKNWNLKRYTLDEYKITNPEFFENGDIK